MVSGFAIGIYRQNMPGKSCHHIQMAGIAPSILQTVSPV